MLLSVFCFMSHMKIFNFLVSKLPMSSNLSEDTVKVNGKIDVDDSNIDPIDQIIKPFEQMFLHPYEVIIENNFPNDLKEGTNLKKHSFDFQQVIERLALEKKRSFRKHSIHLIACCLLFIHSFALFVYLLFLGDFIYLEIFGNIPLPPIDENEPYIIL